MSIQEISTMIGAVTAGLGVLATIFWNGYWFIRVEKINTKIRAAEDDYDVVEPDVIARTSGHLVTQGQADKMIEARRKPIQRKIERLKQERDFAKDKLLFIKK